jgi:hypothetical protein
MSFNLGVEVVGGALAPEHGLASLGLQNPSDCRRQSLPPGGFFSELFAARRREGIKPRLAVVGRGSPLRGNPAALLQPLQSGIKCSVLHKQFFVRGLLNGARDSLAMLRTKNQRAQDEQVQRALEKFQPFFVFLGRHLTQQYACSGKMSTPISRRSHTGTQQPLRELSLPVSVPSASYLCFGFLSSTLNSSTLFWVDSALPALNLTFSSLTYNVELTTYHFFALPAYNAERSFQREIIRQTYFI